MGVHYYVINLFYNSIRVFNKFNSDLDEACIYIFFNHTLKYEKKNVRLNARKINITTVKVLILQKVIKFLI